jgi:hypothetical protein
MDQREVMEYFAFPDLRVIVGCNGNNACPGLDADLIPGNALHSANDGNDRVNGRGAFLSWKAVNERNRRNQNQYSPRDQS